MNGVDQQLIKKGWLKKQGGIVRNWLDRWFVLKGKSLFYFTKEDECKQQGTIELQDCKLTEIPYNRDEPERWLLEISQVSRGYRSNEAYLLWADSEAQRTEWLSALRRALYADIGGGVFGGALLSITRYDKRVHNCDVPHVVKGCVEIILENGKEVEGIFRLSGRLAQVKEMRRRYDEGQRPNLTEECVDVHTAASVLKLYFRQLPEPVIPFEHFESFLNLATSFRYNSNHNQTLSNLKALVETIPQENYKLLDYLTSFLFEISKYQQVNKMTEKNIALIFGTNILRALDNSPEFEMATQNLTTHVVLALVKWHDFIFNKSNEEVVDIKIDEKEIERIVSLAGESLADDTSADSSLTNDIQADPPSPETSNLVSPAVEDLLGIDFTPGNQRESKPRAPPPIPARTKDVTGGLDSVSSDLGLSADICSYSNVLLDSSNSLSTTRPIPAPRGGEVPDVRKRTSSTKNRSRPTAILRQESTPPSSPNRKSGSLPITRVERAQSNFTSFIDSPLDSRVSLNIGDLPNNVEDLQALILSLKIEMKQLRASNAALKQDNENLKVKHQEQVGNLAGTIHQERQTKDEAVARVVKLTGQLALYQSKYGVLGEDE